MSRWRDVFEGRACRLCNGRRRLFVVYWWLPRRWQHQPVEGFYSVRAHCMDRDACAARVAKRQLASKRRAGILILAEPKEPNAQMGQCRWCGEKLTGLRASRRNYCYQDREGRDCVGEWNRSRTWDTRIAIRKMARLAGEATLSCADCGVLCERLNDRGGMDGTECAMWEADHEIPLEDGGEHALENLKPRCVECHRKKTARENSARAELRRAA